MLPKQAISHTQLIEEGFTREDIARMSASLRFFPTPFKGIYYFPSEEERSGWFLDKPLRVLTLALSLFLSTNRFYYSCATAEEAEGIRWRPSGEIHVVNEKKSLNIDLAARIARNAGKKTFRAKKIARLLSQYGNRIVLHKTRSIEGAKIRRTPIGAFAMKSQIRIDKKRFREG